MVYIHTWLCVRKILSSIGNSIFYLLFVAVGVGVGGGGSGGGGGGGGGGGDSWVCMY